MWGLDVTPCQTQLLLNAASGRDRYRRQRLTSTTTWATQAPQQPVIKQFDLTDSSSVKVSLQLIEKAGCIRMVTFW